tara:strand:- start:1921 stop:2646 length:726 start_codon:yes stop_codon:yes gene_type:complete
MAENQQIECERPDKQMMEYSSGYSGSGKGYNQSCGGWEHTETGVIYAIANWGSSRFWKKKDTSHIDGSVYPPMVREETNIRHGYHAQMMWWFNEKDIDVTKLVPIIFRWHDAPVGKSYVLQAGPMEGHRVEESLPAEIPRAMMHAVHEKRYLDADEGKHEAPVSNPPAWWADVVTSDPVSIKDAVRHIPIYSKDCVAEMLEVIHSIDSPAQQEIEVVEEETPQSHGVSASLLGNGMNGGDN